jgi:hypothetical protein
LKKIVGVLAATAALAVVGVMPASAGQSDVVKGAKYKAEYDTGAGMSYNLKMKVRKNGKVGSFTLKCAGIKQAEIEIKKGHFKLAFGGDEIQVKGRGHFLKNDQVKGAITKIITPGATCAGGGSFFGAAIDTD